MKGILHKTEQGWIVVYDEIIGENIVKKNQNSLPLIDNGHIDGLKLYDSNEGLEVDFEIVTDYDNNGPEHFPKYAKILTPEEAELKDWDVTLNDGLENEPYVSDDFQIGPDGAYEHIEENKTMTPKEKAKELFDKYADEFNFDDTYRGYREQSKQCALVVVDEIIKECYNWNGSDNVQWETKRFNYWNDVKQEIKNL
jgi:hypothetical protein